MDNSLQSGNCFISVKLTSHGSYIWNIGYTFPAKDLDNAIEYIGRVDSKLKDKFPKYVIQGSGRIEEI
jgi:hypothetical protein